MSLTYWNSTIKKPVGQCIDCPPNSGEKPLVAKRCPTHYKIHRSSLVKKALKKRVEAGVPANYKDLTISELMDLNFWFDQRKNELALKPYCMECGAFIPEQFYKDAVAHIFPKSKFPSIRTHRWNYIFLGAGCGCHDRSHRVDTFCKMKCFPLAIQRYMMFKDVIKERHKYLGLFEEQVELYQAYLL